MWRVSTHKVTNNLKGWAKSLQKSDHQKAVRLLSTSRVVATQYPKPGTHSYISLPAQVPLLPLTVGNLVDRSAALYPDSPAVVVYEPTETRKSYQQLKKEVDKLAAGFLASGLEKGDRVGIWGTNSYEWYLTFLASIKAGLIAVHINPAYQRAELLYCLNKVSVKCVVVGEPFKTSNYYGMMVETCPEIASSDPGKIKAKSVPSLRSVVTLPATPQKGAHTFQEILEAGSKPDSLETLRKIEKLVQFDDVADIQYTSGTTGNPKGVMLSHHNIVNNGYFLSRRFGYTDKDKICLPVPLFHCFGCVMGVLSALNCGASVVMPSPGFSPPHALKAIAKEKCTIVYGTPTMHIDMIHSPEFAKHDVSSLRLAVTAGAICPEEMIRKMKEKYTVENVGSCYGLTEASPVFFQSLPDDSDKLRAETVGYPMEHVEVKIVDDEGKIVPVGEKGDLCVRGYCVMKGYWEDAEKTAETIDDARWLHSGDLAVMSETGHTRIVGRLKDMIIRGGENIYPREIEDFFHTHPNIQEAQIFSIPDTRMGEEVCGWIKLKEGTNLSEEELRAFCKGKIAHYKVPRHIRFVNEFPKTASGKVQKFKMRATTIDELKIK